MFRVDSLEIPTPRFFDAFRVARFVAINTLDACFLQRGKKKILDRTRARHRATLREEKWVC